MIESFPLDWPVDYKRTRHRTPSRFKVSMGYARDFLKSEVRRLGGSNLIISTNIPVRNDGELYAAYLQKKIDDPGVATYFKWNDKPILMCCDKYERVWENIYALAKGIEAIRGMERWGVSDFLERAFTGFKALPEETENTWWTVLRVSRLAGIEEIKSAYRSLSKQYHPDVNASGAETFIKIKAAYEEAIKSLTVKQS